MGAGVIEAKLRFQMQYKLRSELLAHHWVGCPGGLCTQFCETGCLNDCTCYSLLVQHKVQDACGLREPGSVCSVCRCGVLLAIDQLAVCSWASSELDPLFSLRSEAGTVRTWEQGSSPGNFRASTDGPLPDDDAERQHYWACLTRLWLC